MDEKVEKGAKRRKLFSLNEGRKKIITLAKKNLLTLYNPSTYSVRLYDKTR